MVAHRMPSVPTLVQATLPRQKPTYLALIQKGNCSIPEALAQTCWVKMEKNGKLHVDEDE
jgi:hypothetical protein